MELKREEKKRKIAFWISFFLPGFGQLYRGRIGSGLFFIAITYPSIYFFTKVYKGMSPAFISVVIGYLTIWFLNLLDAYKGPIYQKPPCRRACPADIDVAGYIQLIREGRFDDALELIAKKAPFPGVLGYLCPAPCEKACSRRRYDEPVHIKHLKRAASTYGKLEFKPPKNERNVGVAVVGGGPAGLSAAHYLRQAGFRVTVYEREPEPGGMMRYGVPDYRLPKHITKKEVQRLIDEGIEFKTGVELGRDYTVDELSKEYDVVIVSIGDYAARRLGVEGEDLERVYTSLDFLFRVNKGDKPDIGDEVIVIGGGDVAIDSARVSLRLGAKKVTIVSLEKTDLKSPERLPADDKEIEEALEEGVVFHGELGVKRLVSKDGKIEVHTKKCVSVFDESGRFNPEFDESVETPVSRGDSVIVAIGQGAERRLLENIRGENVYVIRGAPLVVEAIARGRKLAEKIIRKYDGPVKSFINWVFSFEYYVKPKKLDKRPEIYTPVKIEQEHPDKRKSSFIVVDKEFSLEDAKREASRCLQCPYRYKV